METDDDWEFRNFAYEERKEKLKRENNRREPLTSSFLQKFFSTSEFCKALGEVAKRAVREKAEGGFIVYKKYGSDDFVLIRRYGMREVHVGDSLWRAVGTRVAHIPMMDDVSEVRKKLKGGKEFIRVGQLHFHPDVTPAFSEQDIINHEENFLGRSGSVTKKLVPFAFEGFNMLGVVAPARDRVELFGISLPYGGLVSTGFQSLPFYDSVGQEEILRRSGFRVVRTELPFNGKSVKIDSDHIQKLAKLGSQH